MASLFHSSPFSLRQLQYAVAVAETGGFGRAAEVCAVSQPSLSAQVAKLEDGLGVQLFERHARGVQLTSAGRELIPRMRALVQSGKALESSASALSDPYGVTLRVGIIPTIAPYLLPVAVEDLRRRARPIRVHWMELQTADCEEALGAGELDAMVIADPPTSTAVESTALGWEPLELIVPTDHPLRGPVTLHQVAQYPVLLLEDGHCLRDHTVSLCLEPDAEESPYRATSLPTLVQMVASGYGISVIPASAAPIETQRAEIRAMPFEDPGVGRTLFMGWRSRSPHRELLVELSEILTAAVPRALPG